jgi:ribosomal protein L37AE/L43A
MRVGESSQDAGESARPPGKAFGWRRVEFLPTSGDSAAHDATKGFRLMAKGHLCPICGTYTLQRISTNWLQCSDCGLKKPVE